MNNNNPNENLQEFFDFKIKISSYFVIPFVLYFIYLIYLNMKIRHSFNPFRQLSEYSINNKIRNIIFILFCNAYEIALVFIYNSLISKSDEIAYILLTLVKIFLLIFIIFLIKEQSLNIKKSNNLHYLLFWVVFSFKNFLELKIELEFKIFFSILTLKFVDLIMTFSMIFLYVVYPNDIIYKDLKKENVEFELPLINDFSTTYFNSKRNSMLISISSTKSTKSSVITNFVSNRLKEEKKNNNEEMLSPRLLPDINVIFNKKIKYKQDFLDIINSPDEDIIEIMYLKFKVFVNNPKCNLKLKRKIKDFIELHNCLNTEFTPLKYKKRVCDNIPSLIDFLEINKSGNWQNEHIVYFDQFLNKILNSKIFITEDVLKFLELSHLNLNEIFNNERKRFLRKSFTHKFSINNNNKFNLSEISEINSKQSITNMRTEIASTKIFNNYKIKKVDVLEIILLENYFKTKPENYCELNVEVKIDIYYDDLVKTVYKSYKDIEIFVLEQKDMKFNCILISDDNLNKKFLLQNKKEIITNLNSFFKEIIGKKVISDSFKSLYKEVFVKEYDLMSVFNFDYNNYNYRFMKNLHKTNQIDSITIDIPSYTFIQNTYFKVMVFYEIHFDVKLSNGNFEKIVQKYKYKEIDEFIRKFNLKTSKKFVLNPHSSFTKYSEKYLFRLNELNRLLKLIFESKKNLENLFWFEILLYNKSFREMKFNESRNETPICSLKLYTI